MPLYDYRCTEQECDHTEEDVLIQTSDTKERTCSECGGEMERLINGSNRIFFNSDGSHRTDYEGKNSQ